jgi:hypothetical protein
VQSHWAIEEGSNLVVAVEWVTGSVSDGFSIGQESEILPIFLVCHPSVLKQRSVAEISLRALFGSSFICMGLDLKKECNPMIDDDLILQFARDYCT